MPTKPLRAVAKDERRKIQPTLLEAVASGDQLDILLAQRRLIAESLSTAGDSVRPQLSNELTKLNALIVAEQDRREAHEKPVSKRGDQHADESFDASAI